MALILTLKGHQLQTLRLLSFLFFLSALSSGCTLLNNSQKSQAPPPLRPEVESASQGLWSGVMVFKDKVEMASQSLTFDLWMIKNKAFRMDLSHPLGGAVASIVSSPKRSRALFYHQKMHVKSSSKAFFVSESARVPLDFSDIMSIFFYQKNPKWKCLQKQLLRCRKAPGLSYSISQSGKEIIISGKTFSIEIEIHKFKSTPIDPTVWKLKKPKNFKSYRLGS